MPSRLLREGILDSQAVNALSFPAECFYRRLMSVVDDFGRFDGRPSVLRSRLYPLLIDKVREADITRWIAECEKAGLIVLYSVSGKHYILFHKLGSPRAKESKYPPPTDGTDQPPNPHPFTDANGCAQMKTDVPGSDSGASTGSRGRKTPPNPPPGFDRFWAAYPRKEAKAAAGKAFGNLSPDEDLLTAMLAALAWQRESFDWTKDGGRFIPHPATWLNNRRWEDEKPLPGVGKPNRPATRGEAQTAYLLSQLPIEEFTDVGQTPKLAADTANAGTGPPTDSR